MKDNKDRDEVLAIVSGENLCVNEFIIDEKDINTSEKINDFFSDPEDLGYYFTKGLGLEIYDCPSEGLILGTLSDNDENKLDSVDVDIKLDSDDLDIDELDIDITNVKNMGEDEFPALLKGTPKNGEIFLTYYFIAQDAIYELITYKKNRNICIEVESSWKGAIARNTETSEFEFTGLSTGESYDHMLIISFDDGKRIECECEHEEIIKSISEYLISKGVFNEMTAKLKKDYQEIRYFEFKDAHSSKFWEVSVAGSTVTVRYGKIGTNGQTSVKELDSPEQAQEHATKQAAGKLKKGYQELQKNAKG